VVARYRLAECSRGPLQPCYVSRMAGCSATRATLGWMYLVMLTACGAPEKPADPIWQPDASLVDRVTEWSLGEPLRRMVRKKTRAAARLLLLPQQGAPRPLLTDCVNARSLLPSSMKSEELYLIVDGALHVIDTSNLPPALARIATEPADVVLFHLLAMSRQAPVELLALAHQSTRDGQASAPALWRFVIDGSRARGALVRDQARLADADTFFRHFSAPRCRENGADCLVIANGHEQSVLDVQPRPGEDKREWRALEATQIEDARWHPSDQRSALLLVRCRDENTP
jgi:hypothetical protein